MKCLGRLALPGLLALVLPLTAYPQAKPAAEKAPAMPAPVPATPVRLVLGKGEATSSPTRLGCAGFAHTGGGNMLVSQPAPNVIVVTMTGAALAKTQLCKDSLASWQIDLDQAFEVVYGPQVKSAQLSMEGRLIGALRSARGCVVGASTAEIGKAHAALCCGPQQLMAIVMPPRTVTHGDNQAIYAHEGPLTVPVAPGCYTLHQAFDISASVRKCSLVCKGPAAEFAPEPAYDPALYGAFDPFVGTATRDFGFRVTIRVTPD